MAFLHVFLTNVCSIHNINKTSFEVEQDYNGPECHITGLSQSSILASHTMLLTL